MSHISRVFFYLKLVLVSFDWSRGVKRLVNVAIVPFLMIILAKSVIIRVNMGRIHSLLAFSGLGAVQGISIFAWCVATNFSRSNSFENGAPFFTLLTAAIFRNL